MRTSTLTIALVVTTSLCGCGDKFGDGSAGPGTDAGATDAGATDAGATDAGATDAGTTDAGATDAGSTDGGGSTPSVWDQVNPDNCTDLPDFEGVSGAASYVIGEYSPAGAPTTGTETWALYANPVWEDAGGGDCVVVWAVTATPTTVGSCGSCDYGLSVSATVDLTATSCDPGLYAGDESWTTTYDVDEKSDGTADWYFASTGTALGSGYLGSGAGAGVSFITADSCVWFGR